MLRLLSAVPKFTVTALIVVAIVNLLVGVILRYFVGAITDWLDVDPVPFRPLMAHQPSARTAAESAVAQDPLPVG